MNYQEAVKTISAKRVNESGLKAGHIYRNIETGELYRVFGFTLDTDNLDTMVIYAEVNDPITRNLFNTPIDKFAEKTVICK